MVAGQECLKNVLKIPDSRSGNFEFKKKKKKTDPVHLVKIFFIESKFFDQEIHSLFPCKIFL